MTANIFISFASKDVRGAMTLCTALENRGFKCWISARDIQPGENFQIAIVRAIRQAKIMLLVFTANSNASEEMTKELALASQQKMIVIPLRVEDVTPSDAFAYEFATRQWIDFFADWESAIEQLTQRIANALRERSAGLETNVAADAVASLNLGDLPDPPEVDEDELAAAEAAAAAVTLEPPPGKPAKRAVEPPPPKPAAAPAPTPAAKKKPEPVAAANVKHLEGASPMMTPVALRRLAVVGGLLVVLVGISLALPAVLRSLEKEETPAVAEAPPLTENPQVAVTPAVVDPALTAPLPEVPVAPVVKAAPRKKAVEAPAEAPKVDIPF
jgi:hypothetical protein